MTKHKNHATRRETILAATRKVVREGGLRAANVRSIASVAGTSPASVLYYYDSVDQLIENAIGQVVKEYYVDRRELISTISNPIEKIRQLIRLGVPDTVADDMRVVYEVAASLDKYPKFAGELRSIHERQVALYAEVITEGEVSGFFKPLPDTETVARNIVAMEDTYDFYQIIGITESREGLREKVRSYARLALSPEI